MPRAHVFFACCCCALCCALCCCCAAVRCKSRLSIRLRKVQADSLTKSRAQDLKLCKVTTRRWWGVGSLTAGVPLSSSSMAELASRCVSCDALRGTWTRSSQKNQRPGTSSFASLWQNDHNANVTKQRTTHPSPCVSHVARTSWGRGLILGWEGNANGDGSSISPSGDPQLTKKMLLPLASSLPADAMDRF